MKSRVLITGKLHPSAIEAFVNHQSFDIDYRPDCARADLEMAMREAQVIVSRSETRIDKELIDIAPELKVIARAAVGVGNIDIDYATEKGILVINTPGKNTNSAAELTIGLIISLLRKLPSAIQQVRSGGWDRHRYVGREMRGKRIGIVGLGNVGHRVAKFCLGLDMEVRAYDPYISPEIFTRHSVKSVTSLEELAKASDILTLHVPLNKETRHMISNDILEQLPHGAYIVNAARGGVVDEELLLSFLENGKLSGVALDTYEDEPTPKVQLIEHPKVIGSPHIGASTEEAQIEIGRAIFDQVVKAVHGHVVDYPVNLPNIGVIEHPILKAYSVLSEKLGSFIGQMLQFNPKSIHISYRGDIAGRDTTILRLSLMKGYLQQNIDDYVSFVNVERHFQQLGIAITEQNDHSFSSYKSAIKIMIEGEQDQKLTVGGVVFDERYLRLTLINDFYFEVEPQGSLLIFTNKDRPGVIGHLAGFLGKNEINISSFNLSRNTQGGQAMAVVSIDGKLQSELITDIQKLPNIESVQLVSL